MRVTLLAVTGTLALSSMALAEQGAQLGSPDFMPSAERPLGWRNDGTGRYPGATPPIEWYRKVKCLAYELRCQANKPKNGETGKPVIEQYPFADRYVPEWLILGPFAQGAAANEAKGNDKTQKDRNKGVEQDPVPNAAEIEPSAGDKIPSTGSGQAADHAWTLWAGKPWVHQGWYRETPPSGKETVEPKKKKGNKDDVEDSGGSGEKATRYLMPEDRIGFGDACGKEDGAATYYAHTYLYAPRDGQIDMPYGIVPQGAYSFKMWINGKVVTEKSSPYGATVNDASLKKGWNRLLLKISKVAGKPCDELTLVIRPSFNDLSYESKNVKWMMPLVNSGSGAPSIVGDKIYVASDNADVACYQKADGKMLWLKTIHSCYSAGDAEKKNPVFAEKVEPLIRKMEALEIEIVKEANAFLDSNAPSSKTAPDKIARLANQKKQIWLDLQKAMVEVDGEKYAKPGGTFGSSGSGGPGSSAPATDGKVVCISSPTGVAGCFDLGGNRQWVRCIDPKRTRHAPEHGNCSSPLLFGGRFIVVTGQGSKMPMSMVAYDVKTGDVAWDVPALTTYQSPVGYRIGKIDIAIDPCFSKFIQVSDGKVLWDAKGEWNGYAPTVPIADGLAFVTGAYGDRRGPWAFKMPASEAELSAGPKKLVRLEGNSWGVPSPLYHDGLVYGLDIYSILRVSDVQTGKLVYEKALPLHAYRHLRFGTYPSPALAGKYIYITDNEACTIVIEPGREYKEIARSQLDFADQRSGRIHDRAGAPGYGPIFEGNNVYFRAERNLYCIAKTNK